MKISLSYVNKKHPDLPIIKKALEETEKLFVANKKDSGIDCIMRLGVQIENNLFALLLARKHFEKLNKPEEALLFQELFRNQMKNNKSPLLHLIKSQHGDNNE